MKRLRIVRNRRRKRLYRSIQFGALRTAKKLLILEVDPNDKGRYRLNPLHYAIFKKRVSFIALLVKYGANKYQTSHRAWYPLHHALEKKSVHCIRMLLKLGVNPNGITCENFDYPVCPLFHLAYRTRNIEIVKAFVEAGVDVNIKDKSKRTVLNIRFKIYCEKLINIINYLFENKLDVNNVDNFGITPISLAISWNHTQLANIFLIHGANPCQLDEKGNSIISRAIEWYDGSSFELLYNFGADINILSSTGEPLLHKVFQWECKDAIISLLQVFQNINVLNNQGISAFHRTRMQRFMKILLLSGISPDNDCCNNPHNVCLGCSNQKVYNIVYHETVNLQILCFRLLRTQYHLDNIRALIPQPMMAKITQGIIHKNY